MNNQREDGLLDQIVSRKNMIKAYKRVVSNKCSAGIDGIQVEDLENYLNKHWEEIKQSLLTNGYYAKSVRQVEIAKPNGRVRLLREETAQYMRHTLGGVR